MAKTLYICYVLKAFKEHIESRKLFKQNDKLLVAISGGIDSVVMSHLLKKCGYQFALAHCNFRLRKKDSDYDEDFCLQLSKSLGVDFYVNHFDVKTYQKKNKLSLQMAARQMRYLWFRDLLAEKKIDYLLTAHHGNDAIETTFINFLRGTGINGLKGIPEKAGQIVRPMLSFTKAEIVEYATQNNISFRLDKSNLEDKYERNFLRLNIIPAFKKLHPNVEKTILNNISNFGEEAEIVNEFLTRQLNKIASKKGKFIYMDKKLLVKEKYCRTLLHFALAPFGFNASQIKDIERNISTEGLAGKELDSFTHRLTIDRTSLVITENNAAEPETMIFETLEDLKNYPGIQLKKTRTFSIPANNELLLEPGKLILPLQIRRKMKGDKFKPFGMRGFRLLSDFLKDLKLNNFEKESCKLLVNGNGEIIWVMGYRSDERYKVNTKSTELIKLTLA